MTTIVARRAVSGLVEGPGRGRGWLRPLIYAVLVTLSLIWIVPILWAVATSLKPDAETTIAPVSWRGSTETLDAYRVALEQGNILKWYFNSLVTASVITAGTIVTASMAAFAFSRMRFRGRDVLQWMLLAGLIVPFQALIVPLFMQMKALGLADTYWGIILPQLASPIAVLVYKRAFDAVPRELEESALVDGASMWRIYRWIWMPLSRATTAAVGDLHVRARVEQLLLAVRGHERGLAVHDPGRAGDRADLLRRAVRAADGARGARSAAAADRVRAVPAPDRAGDRQHRPQGLAGRTSTAAG